MKPRIFIIEGPSKIGKSSQAFLLSQKLPKSKRFAMDSVLSVEQISEITSSLIEWLSQDNENVVIMTGSIAFTIINKDIESGVFGKSYLEYDDYIRGFLEILKTYNYKAILLKPKELSFLEERQSDFNSIQENAIYKGLKHFENLYSNANFRWNEIIIYSYDSMLDIQKKIQKIL